MEEVKRGLGEDFFGIKSEQAGLQRGEAEEEAVVAGVDDRSRVGAVAVSGLQAVAGVSGGTGRVEEHGPEFRRGGGMEARFLKAGSEEWVGHGMAEEESDL